MSGGPHLLWMTSRKQEVLGVSGHEREVDTASSLVGAAAHNVDTTRRARWRLSPAAFLVGTRRT